MFLKSVFEYDYEYLKVVSVIMGKPQSHLELVLIASSMLNLTTVGLSKTMPTLELLLGEVVYNSH